SGRLTRAGFSRAGRLPITRSETHSWPRRWSRARRSTRSPPSSFAGARPSGHALKRAHLILTASLWLLLLAPANALAASHADTHARTGTARGAVTWVDQDSLSMLQGTHRIPVLAALVRSANAVDQADYPYVYAGGHASAGTATVGRKGPGYTGRRIGYDCSGSVAAALSGAGLWPAGAPVPADNGVIAQLLREGIIARGPGTVTLYDKPGVHIFMNIAGR